MGKIDVYYEAEQRLDDASNHFHELIKMLYSDSLMDRVAIQTKIDTIAYYLGCEIPEGDLTIQRRKSHFFGFATNLNRYEVSA